MKPARKPKAARKPKPAGKPKPIVGWRESIELPELCATPIKAKIDTGALTSALHAFNLSVVERDGDSWADFEIHPVQRSKRAAVTVSHPVAGFRKVRSSSGHLERRPVIKTPIQIGSHCYHIEISLASRDEMGFRMLLGRAALRRRFVVDPGRSYLQSPAPRPKGHK